MDDFIPELSRQSAGKTIGQNRAYLNILVEYFDPDRLLATITKQDASEVKKVLQALPASWNTKPKSKAMPGRQGEPRLRGGHAEPALGQRTPTEADKLIHHSDRRSQCLSIRYTERLAEAGIDTSVGSVRVSYDNAPAESIIGLFKTEGIKFLGPRKSVGQVEWETLKWVDWYNNTRLHSAIGYITPNEAEEAFYANLNAAEKAA